jgi:hypothetical protein
MGEAVEEGEQQLHATLDEPRSVAQMALMRKITAPKCEQNLRHQLCRHFNDRVVGTPHNTTHNPYSFNQTILLLQPDNSYSFGQTIQTIFTPSIRQFFLPKPYGKAQIFIHYQPANQRSQQQHKHS